MTPIPFPDSAPYVRCRTGSIMPLPTDASLARCESCGWMHRQQPDGSWSTWLDVWAAGTRGRRPSRKAAGAPPAARTSRRGT